jgi:hypothetical protein
MSHPLKGHEESRNARICLGFDGYIFALTRPLVSFVDVDSFCKLSTLLCRTMMIGSISRRRLLS